MIVETDRELSPYYAGWASDQLELARHIYREQAWSVISSVVSVATECLNEGDPEGFGMGRLRALAWARAEWHNGLLPERREP